MFFFRSVFDSPSCSMYESIQCKELPRFVSAFGASGLLLSMHTSNMHTSYCAYAFYRRHSLTRSPCSRLSMIHLRPTQVTTMRR